MNQDFTYVLRVRYSECDQQKVVFNGRYAEYVDLAATEFIRALWGEHTDLFARGIDFQVVNLNINWRASAHFDDVIAISVRTKHIGNTSYSFVYEFHNRTTGKQIVVAQAVYVMVDIESLTKMQIPEDLRITLEAGAPGIVVDQSGL